MGFSRQEYWSGLPFPSPGDLSHTGIKPRSPILHIDSLPTELQENLEQFFSTTAYINLCFWKLSSPLQDVEQHAWPPLTGYQQYSATVDNQKDPQMFLQFSSVAQSCLTLCNPINRSTPGLLVHHQLLEFTQTHVHRVSDAIQPSHPLSSPCPPAPSIRVFSSESTLHMRWPKYWSFSFSIIPSREIPGLTSFRMD